MILKYAVPFIMVILMSMILINCSSQRSLYKAVVSNDVAQVKLLISQKDNINIRNDKTGKMPIHCAAENGNIEIVELLLNNGANPNEDFNEMSLRNRPLASYSTEEIVMLLYEEDKTPLYWATINCHNEVVKSLIKHGANVNPKNFQETPLHYAVSNDCPDVIKTFLSSGANVNARDRSLGMSSLHYAVKEGNLEIVKILVDNGADINAKAKAKSSVEYPNISNITPLGLAKLKMHQHIIDYLLSKGAN